MIPDLIVSFFYLRTGGDSPQHCLTLSEDDKNQVYADSLNEGILNTIELIVAAEAHVGRFWQGDT